MSFYTPATCVIVSITRWPELPSVVTDLCRSSEQALWWHTSCADRSVFPLVDVANDQPTADLLTQRMDIHEKTAWMLRALLEE